jgi:hypothetical protein
MDGRLRAPFLDRDVACRAGKSSWSRAVVASNDVVVEDRQPMEV